jgi:hypothetical protein
MSQIMAEEGYRLTGNADRLYNTLRALQTEPWQDINHVTSHVGRIAANSEPSIWLTDQPIKVTQVRCKLILANEYARANATRLPLFDVVMMILQMNFDRDLADANGYYRNGDSSVYSARTAKYIQKFDVYSDEMVGLEEDMDLCKKVVSTLIKEGIVTRISKYLQETVYTSGESIPDGIRLFNDTTVLVGGAGWREIGTIENIRELLQNTTLRLSYGKEQQSVALATLL